VSEMPPERPAPARSGGGVGGTFTTKIGPLPMWGWLAIIGGGLIAWRLYSNKQAASTSGSSADTSVPADQVPQFVNQTYVTTTPPMQGPPPVIIRTPGPPPGPQQLTRTWTSTGGSTYAQVAQRLTGRPDVASLHPANEAAQKWVTGPYAKNHNAKMPRGLEFTYTEGTVTPKGK
jgi:hypothetical protein